MGRVQTGIIFRDMLILDEINNAVSYGLLPVDDILEALARRPKSVPCDPNRPGCPPRLMEMLIW